MKFLVLCGIEQNLHLEFEAFSETYHASKMEFSAESR